MWDWLRSVASWLLGLFRATQDLFFLFTLFGSLGVGALVMGILPELTDISSGSAILIGVGVALFSLPLLFPLVAWLLSLAGSRSPATVPVSAPEPVVTGETLASQILQSQYHGIRPAMNYVAKLKLAEIALLRRLDVASGKSQIRWRCEAVLTAGGIVQSTSSIARLEDMDLISINTSDNVSLIDKGQTAVLEFTICLTHDSKLVAAYRQVTPQINRALRFDRQHPISDLETSYA